MSSRDPDANLRSISEVVTGRTGSFLEEDIRSLDRDLRERITNSHVCITGGGGFIARQLLFRLFEYLPARISLLDVSENSLAATMRDVSSSHSRNLGTQVDAVLLDLTSLVGVRALNRLEDVDIVFHLAAVKHVRSELDEASVSRMFSVNVGTAFVLQKFAASTGASLVAVSTDKAAQSQTLMGASKALMESVLLAGPDATVARFPNVAFSSGSLLDSWRRRVDLAEPVPVPRDTRRFLINPREAADMCLAAFAANKGTIVVPREDSLPNLELITVARAFLDHLDRSEHPIELTDRVVASEKSDECFVSPTEQLTPWLTHLAVIQSSRKIDGTAEFWTWMLERFDNANAELLGPELHRRLTSAIPHYRAPVLS